MQPFRIERDLRPPVWGGTRHTPAGAEPVGEAWLAGLGSLGARLTGNHAIGPGVLAYEVQQPSDITYRCDDRGRPAMAGRIAARLPEPAEREVAHEDAADAHPG